MSRRLPKWKPPSLAALQAAYENGESQTLDIIDGYKYRAPPKPKRGRPRLSPEQREVSNIQAREWRKKYHQKYYITVTKPKRQEKRKSSN